MPCVKISRNLPDRISLDVSMSVSFGPVGKRYSVGDRSLTCPAICCFAFSPIGCRPISWATSIAIASVYSIVRDRLRRRRSVPLTAAAPQT
jgi:hypothetical protein